MELVPEWGVLPKNPRNKNGRAADEDSPTLAIDDAHGWEHRTWYFSMFPHVMHYISAIIKYEENMNSRKVARILHDSPEGYILPAVLSPLGPRFLGFPENRVLPHALHKPPARATMRIICRTLA